jgi:hypothetical protein
MTTPNTPGPDFWAPPGPDPDIALPPAGGTTSESERPGTRAHMREMKDQVVDQARSSFQQARDKASTSLGESRRSAAERLGGLAGAIRRTSEHLRAEDQARMASLTQSLASEVEEVAGYLRETDARGMLRDLEGLARRHPAAVAGTAFALGLLGARFLRSSERGGMHARD